MAPTLARGPFGERAQPRLEPVETAPDVLQLAGEDIQPRAERVAELVHRPPWEVQIPSR